MAWNPYEFGGSSQAGYDPVSQWGMPTTAMALSQRRPFTRDMGAQVMRGAPDTGLGADTMSRFNDFLNPPPTGPLNVPNPWDNQESVTDMQPPDWADPTAGYGMQFDPSQFAHAQASPQMHEPMPPPQFGSSPHDFGGPLEPMGGAESPFDYSQNPVIGGFSGNYAADHLEDMNSGEPVPPVDYGNGGYTDVGTMQFGDSPVIGVVEKTAGREERIKKADEGYAKQQAEDERAQLIHDAEGYAQKAANAKSKEEAAAYGTISGNLLKLADNKDNQALQVAALRAETEMKKRASIESEGDKNRDERKARAADTRSWREADTALRKEMAETRDATTRAGIANRAISDNGAFGTLAIMTARAMASGASTPAEKKKAQDEVAMMEKRRSELMDVAGSVAAPAAGGRKAVISGGPKPLPPGVTKEAALADARKKIAEGKSRAAVQAVLADYGLSLDGEE